MRHLCRPDPWPSYVNETSATMNIKCYSAMWGPNEFTCNGVLSGYDGSLDLASIEVPILLTCGEFDEATPTSCSVFAEMISNSELTEFANASHMAFVEDRASYVAKVREFLRTGLK